jgi:hypothetical protein
MHMPRDAQTSSKMLILWILIAFVFGLSIWGAAFWYTGWGRNEPDLVVSLGNSGLALAFGGVLGGLVKKLFDAWDDRKKAREAQIAFYIQLLEDFKTVYNMVERSRFLITAHKSAKTYGERLRLLPDATILLHNMKRATRQGYPDLYNDLEAPIFFYMIFIRNLVTEYRDNYLRISRLQSQDEVDNKFLREKINSGRYARDTELAQNAWIEIKDLQHLKVLLDATDETAANPDNAGFKSYETAFLQYIDLASYHLMLRMPGSTESLKKKDLDDLSRTSRAAMETAKLRFATYRS